MRSLHGSFRPPRAIGVAAFTAAVIGLTACGGGGGDTAPVATDSSMTSTAPGGGDGASPFAAYTACLRDEGLDVPDVDLGGGPGRSGGADGSMPDRSFPDGSFPDGSFPSGSSRDGSTPDGSVPGGFGGDGSGRIVEMLGLDADDPAVAAALEACASALDTAMPSRGAPPDSVPAETNAG